MYAMRTAAAAVTLVLLAGAVFGDVFVLKDGRRIQGKLLRKTADHYVVQTGLGELELKRTDVSEIIEVKTDREVFDERFAAAATADEFAGLGAWAEKKRMRSLAKKAFARAIELVPDHAGAHKGLGHVLYKGEWMTPEERDARVVAEEEADMKARGLVRLGDRWVSPEEKEKLDAGMVFHEGAWVTPDELMRIKGFELFRGEWLPREEAVAREDIDVVVGVSGRALEVVITGDAALAGDWDFTFLEEIGAGLGRGRGWFDEAFSAPPGLELFGGRMAQLYVWNRDDAPYVATVDHFASLTDTVPEGWSEATKKNHGLYWIHPYPLSSARVRYRPEGDLVGHNYHHWGHLLLGRLGYEGRLLPPWYDEAVASLLEFRVHGRNAVFCRSRGSQGGRGTNAAGATSRYSFDPNLVREGGWKDALGGAIEEGQVPTFDRLAQKQFSDLDLMDVAAGMAIVEWIEEVGDLAPFHAALREHAPASPVRVIQAANDRHACYDAAFKAATGKGLREADREWREWVLSR